MLPDAAAFTAASLDHFLSSAVASHSAMALGFCRSDRPGGSGSGAEQSLVRWAFVVFLSCFSVGIDQKAPQPNRAMERIQHFVIAFSAMHSPCSKCRVAHLVLVRSMRRIEYKVLTFHFVVALTALVCLSAHAQSTESAASPEMARLAQALAGDWTTVEILQQGKPVPDGVGRKGDVHVRLTGGGTVLASEGHSVGTIGGDLRWFITIWWDKEATCYRLLTCFRTKTSAGCELRGTAHWEDDRLINDYEEVINGKRTKMQDIWSDITPNSYTLTAAQESGDGTLMPYVVSRNRRKGPG
jgi:hypothetical protein